jgi:hypothetical protein
MPRDLRGIAREEFRERLGGEPAETRGRTGTLPLRVSATEA